MLAMLLGNLIACKLSDWYGRRYTFIGVSVLMGVGHGLSAVAIDPYSYAAARFLSGMGLSGKCMSHVEHNLIQFNLFKSELSCSLKVMSASHLHMQLNSSLQNGARSAALLDLGGKIRVLEFYNLNVHFPILDFLFQGRSDAIGSPCLLYPALENPYRGHDPAIPPHFCYFPVRFVNFDFFFYPNFVPIRKRRQVDSADLGGA